MWVEWHTRRQTAESDFGLVLVPGVIGSAVVAAARCSAGLTRSGLARSLGFRPATVRGWENGEVPLYGVPYTELRRLAQALGRTDAPPGAVLNYLLKAAQWDLLVSEMLAGLADYAELPPIGSDTAQGVVTRDLLAWGFHGIVPDCYREFARPGFLYGACDRLRIAGMLDELRLSTNSELAEYSTVLLALISPDGELVNSPDRRGHRRSDLPAGWWFRRVAR
jgi:transcriptional regulator with XRE-family HTH domain